MDQYDYIKNYEQNKIILHHLYKILYEGELISKENILFTIRTLERDIKIYEFLRDANEKIIYKNNIYK